MNVEIVEETAAELPDYGGVPIAFEVRRVLEVEPRAGGLGGLALSERPVAVPYLKDYDAADGGPSGWSSRFDLRGWGFFAARLEGRRVGGAAVARGTDDVEMLEGRTDLAVLWDLRVAPEVRGGGVGAGLFGAAEAWAAERGCRWLKVETQNVNVPACRLYARMGCELGGIHRFAYPELPDEVQLLWYKAVTAP